MSPYVSYELHTSMCKWTWPGRTSKFSISYVPAWLPCALDNVSVIMAHIKKSRGFLLRGLMCLLKAQLAVTLPSWSFCESLRTLTVPEDRGSIYLRRTKRVKFSDNVTWRFCCGQQHLLVNHSMDCGPVLPTVEIIHVDPVQYHIHYGRVQS